MIGRFNVFGASFVLALALGACGGASTQHVPEVASAESLFSGARAEGASTLAPTFVAEAKLELEAAKRAVAAGDEVTAGLHAQRSIAAMQRAFVVARLARATREDSDARAASTENEAALRKVREERARADAEVETLEKKLHIAREASLPAESGATDPARAVARLRAATSLLAEARLLCGAARLLDGQAKGLTEADTAIAEAEALVAGKPSKPNAAARPKQPIDAAATARVACLSALSHARRTGEQSKVSDDPDVLFSELSAQASKKTPPEAGPVRDERGVVLTLRDAFRGEELSDAGKQALASAALVGRAHPNVSVQVVVHESEANAVASSAKRVTSALKALESGGIPKTKLRGDTAGTSIALVASGDPAKRARNARLDVVFVTR
jgi:hypothetical protein